MALHFPLMVNGNTIGSLYAVRKSGGAEPGDLNTYNVAVETRNADGLMQAKTFTVEHRYGDGAWALVRKALEHMY